MQLKILESNKKPVTSGSVIYGLAERARSLAGCIDLGDKNNE